MNASGAVGYTVAVPIRRESYVIDTDAAGTAYAFGMDDQTRDRLETLIQSNLPGRGRTVDVTVRPGYLRVDAEPNLRTPLREYRSDLVAAARAYNDRVTHEGAELQIDTTSAYNGVHTPEGAQPLSVFVDRLDREEYAEKRGFVASEDPVFSWTRKDPREDAAGGDGRHVAYEAVIQVDPDTYESPGGMTKPSDTFRWNVSEDADCRDPVAYLERPRTDRILGQWGSCMAASLWPTYARVTVHSASLNTSPRGIARQARRHLNALTPNAVGFEKRGRVLPIDPGEGEGIEAWLSRCVPDAVDGQPIEPQPEEPQEQEESSGGLLSSWRTQA